MTMAPSPNKANSQESRQPPHASARDHQQGKSSSQVPMGLSSRINLAYGRAGAGTSRSTQPPRGMSEGEDIIPLMIRLYVDQNLAAGQTVEGAPAQAHYLGNVMRLKPGSEVALFNGRDGEW